MNLLSGVREHTDTLHHNSSLGRESTALWRLLPEDPAALKGHRPPQIPDEKRNALVKLIQTSHRHKIRLVLMILTASSHNCVTASIHISGSSSMLSRLSASASSEGPADASDIPSQSLMFCFSPWRAPGCSSGGSSLTKPSCLRIKESRTKALSKTCFSSSSTTDRTFAAFRASMSAERLSEM